MQTIKPIRFYLDFTEGYSKFAKFMEDKKKLDSLMETFGVSPPPDPDPNSKIPPRITYTITLDFKSAEHDWFIAKLVQLGFKYHYHFKHLFSPEELENSPLFWFGMNFTLNSKRHPINYGTKYELKTICSACGLRQWIQLNDLRLDTSIIKNEYIIQQHGSHIGGGFIIVSKKMVDIMESYDITGYRLQPVVHVGPERRRREVYQLIITNILPPYHSMHVEPMPGEHCTVCGLSGYFPFPQEYLASSLTKFKDFNLAAEYLDYYKVLQQPIMVSRNVRNLLEKLRAHRISWFKPIIIVEK